MKTSKEQILFAILFAVIFVSANMTADYIASKTWFKCECPKQTIKPIATSTTEVATSTPEYTDSIYTKASWYDYNLKGAPGYSKTHETAAARNFSRGEYVKVTNISNGKSVKVRINDYGPDANVHPDREIDLSSHAFSQIASLETGVILVKVEYNR